MSHTLPRVAETNKGITAFSQLLRLLPAALLLSVLQADMQQTLQSFQLRLEAILQHRRLQLLESYGFLRRDFNTTNYSLKGKIPRAASAALGLERRDLSNVSHMTARINRKMKRSLFK